MVDKIKLEEELKLLSGTLVTDGIEWEINREFLAWYNPDDMPFSLRCTIDLDEDSNKFYYSIDSYNHSAVEEGTLEATTLTDACKEALGIFRFLSKELVKKIDTVNIPIEFTKQEIGYWINEIEDHIDNYERDKKRNGGLDNLFYNNQQLDYYNKFLKKLKRVQL